MTKTTPPPALDPRRPLPTDEVAQTYARDAARQVAAQARPTLPAPGPRDQVELEVERLFSSDIAAEAIVAESELPRGTVLSRAVARAAHRGGQ
jgi:hypothetical protein